MTKLVSTVTWTLRQHEYTYAETTVQQMYSLPRNTNPSFVEEKVPFQNMCMS
jgi:hypothetical protein